MANMANMANMAKTVKIVTPLEGSSMLKRRVESSGKSTL